MRRDDDDGFTIVELLVVVSIIALLIGILLPAIGKARDQARLTTSLANLRQLGSGMATYAAEWSDRQFTAVDDNLARYGSEPTVAINNFRVETGSDHPPLMLGYGPGGASLAWWFNGPGFAPILTAINFEPPWEGFGWYRTPNIQVFTRYLSGRPYDPIFWAPKDTMPLAALDECIDAPYEWGLCYESNSEGPDGDGHHIHPTYAWSPAALFNPDVLRNEQAGGFQDPWDLGAGLRCPAMGHARYSDLKTHMIEHTWLQQRRLPCNPAFAGGTYDGCEPYFFNHSWESVPATVFYDGHVSGLGVREAEAADTRMKLQSGHGLWSRDTHLGADGFFIPEGYDFAATSFHMLTTDGIRGRDKLSR